MRGADEGASETASYESLSAVGADDTGTLGFMWVSPTLRFDPLTHGAIIGRVEGCEVRIESDQVSRKHAALEQDGPLWLLRDLKSKNGTWVNMARSEFVSLKDQDTVRVGDWVGVVCSMPRGAVERGTMIETWPPAFLLSASTAACLSSLEMFAHGELPIVIYGDTGTGKDALAQTIHHWSGRSGPFVPVNCAAVPEGMAEALLFGHRKGAFTGAQDANDGYVRAAHDGTLFLDEIADLPLPVQSKLLRVLEEREVTPLGATQSIKVNFRIIAACQDPLERLVEEGVFRKDLHARLRGVELTLPALRCRRQEVVRLLLRFLELKRLDNPKLDPRLIEAVCVYDWPYNIRELEQLAAVLAAPGRATLTYADLPERFRQERSTDDADSGARLAPPPNISVRRKAWLARHVDEFVRLRAALDRHDGNVTDAALEAGVPRHRARRLLAAEAELIDAARG